MSHIVDNEAIDYEIGKIVREIWSDLPRRFDEVSTDAFVVMPNHIHGILAIGAVQSVEDDDVVATDGAGAMDRGPTTLGRIVRIFKAVSTRAIRQNFEPEFAWQRNYYEHIIRDEADLNRIRRYIDENPARWASDHENPDNRGQFHKS